MAAYIGQIVTLDLKDGGGKFCGRLISHSHQDGKIVLSKVTYLTKGNKLPGNQTYYEDEIIPNSMVITDNVQNDTMVSNNILREKKSLSLEKRGSKRDNSSHLPINGDLERETYELGAFLKATLAEDGSHKDIPANLITSNIYQHRTELLPREQWEALSGKEIRPTQYIVIDELGKLFDEAIYRIVKEPVLGFAFTGVDISRRGELCWIQVATTDMVYLFDACRMGHTCIFHGLDKILASRTILKVIHDCRWISDHMFHLYNIKICNIFDTQVAGVQVFRQRFGGDLPAYVQSLQKLVELHLNVDTDEFHVFKIRQAFRDTEEQLWKTRPMHEHLLDSLAKTSSYLNELRLVLEKAMMNDFFVAIDSYVSIIRDMTDEEIDNIPQFNKHRLPLVFTNIQRRDERNRRSQRLKDEANFVTPDGLVETLDNPSDIYYKRDSIMHSRNRRVPSYTPGTTTAKKMPTGSSRYVVPDHLLKELPQATKKGTSNSSATTSLTRATTSQSSSSVNPPIKPILKKPSLSQSSTSSSLTIKPDVHKSVSLHETESSSSKVYPTDILPVNKDKLMSGRTAEDVTPVTTCKSSVSDSSLIKSSTPELESSEHNRMLPTPLTGSASAGTLRSINDMDGVAFTDRRVDCVGRGTSSRNVGRPKYANIPFPCLGAAGSGDSDSGVDNGPITFSNLSSCLGSSAGFQNFELMGTTPITLDQVSDGFDFRSANMSDLKDWMAQKQFQSTPVEKPKVPSTIPVTRHLLRRDGSVKDLDSGLEFNPNIGMDALSLSESSHNCNSVAVEAGIPKVVHATPSPVVETNEEDANLDDSDIEWDD